MYARINAPFIIEYANLFHLSQDDEILVTCKGFWINATISHSHAEFSYNHILYSHLAYECCTSLFFFY